MVPPPREAVQPEVATSAQSMREAARSSRSFFGGGFGDLDRWAIRPEIGFLFDPHQSGHHYTQLSVGVTLFAGKKK